MASKRKYDQVDLDDDEPLLGRQVLPIANLPDSFSGEPSDGLQYLFTVRRNARLLPHIARADNPYEVKEEPRDISAEDFGSGSSHPDLPSEEWREIFLTRFKNFCGNCVQPTLSVPNPHAGPSLKKLPDKKDRDAWWAFLAGRPQAEWDPPKKPKQPKQDRRWRNDRYGDGLRGYSENRDEPRSTYDYQEQGGSYQESNQETWRVNEDGEVELSAGDDPARSLPTPSTTPAPQEYRVQHAEQPVATVQAGPSSAACIPREPTPSLMQHIDHRYALHLLMYFTHWVNLHLETPYSRSWRITDAHARWIFVLLSRVEGYISADDMHLLRSLARACISFIEESRVREGPASEGAVEVESEEDGHMNVQSCWLIITAVVGVWGQRDLWEDAETMLVKTLC